MKKIYWRPQTMPVFAFVAIAAFSLCGIAGVEYFQTSIRKPYHAQKLAAARLALDAMDEIKKEKLEKGLELDGELDPAQSGLIGHAVTLVTSDAGSLEAKQTSINPNFAAVIVELLKEANIHAGDRVAVSITGSFPALNICLYSAMTTLKLKPVIISSAASSQWGANDIDFLWIDMEKILFEKGFFPFHSVAASLGGKNDRAKEMTPKGRQMLRRAIERNELALIAAGSVVQNIDERIKIYSNPAAPRIFVNVGGGLTAAGIRFFKRSLKPGLVTSEMTGDIQSDSLIQRFVKEGTPVIHIGNINQLARQYGMPIAPKRMPPVGEGGVYTESKYNNWLAGGVLFCIVLGLYVFGRVDWGFRILQTSIKKEEGPPAPMV